MGSIPVVITADKYDPLTLAGQVYNIWRPDGVHHFPYSDIVDGLECHCRYGIFFNRRLASKNSYSYKEKDCFIHGRENTEFTQH